MLDHLTLRFRCPKDLSVKQVDALRVSVDGAGSHILFPPGCNSETNDPTCAHCIRYCETFYFSADSVPDLLLVPLYSSFPDSE